MGVGIHAWASRVAVLVAFVAACVGEEYVYSARRFDPDADCLDPYSPVETVPGEGAGSQCAPSCLTAGGDVFVTTMCPPLPTIATAVPRASGECQSALAALTAARTCGSAPDAAADAPAADAAEPDAADEDASEARDAAAPRDATTDG